MSNDIYTAAQVLYREAQDVRFSDPNKAVELPNNAYDMLYQGGMEETHLAHKVTGLRVTVSADIDSRASGRVK